MRTPSKTTKTAKRTTTVKPAKATSKPTSKPTTKAAPNASASAPSASAGGAKTRLSWAEFAGLKGRDGRALTPELLCSQLVGDRVFPDLPSDYDGFEGKVETDQLPANHEMFAWGSDDTEYRVFYSQSGSNEDYKEHAIAAFKALVAAITALHGKPEGSGNHRLWAIGDREIRLNRYFSTGDPYGADVRLRVCPRT